MVEVLSQRRIKPRRLRPYLLYTLPAHTCKCGELLAYSPDRREGSFSETRLPPNSIFGNSTKDSARQILVLACADSCMVESVQSSTGDGAHLKPHPPWM